MKIAKQIVNGPMTISIMDLFYMIMIAVICGFVIHLESQVTMILKMLEELTITLI